MARTCGVGRLCSLHVLMRMWHSTGQVSQITRPPADSICCVMPSHVAACFVMRFVQTQKRTFSWILALFVLSQSAT